MSCTRWKSKWVLAFAWALAFLTPITACSDRVFVFFWITWIMPVILVHSLLHLNSVRIFLFVHAGLLTPLLDYLNTGKDHSWACSRRSVKISQLSWTPLLSRTASFWNSSKLITEQSCSVEVQGCDAVIWLCSLLWGSWILFTVTVTKGAPELHAPKNSSFSVSTRFSRLPVPFWNLTHLCQKVTVSTFWKPTGLLVFCCDVNKIV